MTAPICPNCAVPMHGAASSAGPDKVLHYFICPRCRTQADERLEDGQIEVEEDWFLEISVPKGISPAQLRAIRGAQAPLGEVSMAAFRDLVLRSTVLRLGPYRA